MDFFTRYFFEFCILFFIFVIGYCIIFQQGRDNGGYRGIGSVIEKPYVDKTSKPEKKCRRILQRLFDKEFPCVRPDFLYNPLTGKNLELDMYNEELGLAVEYNGKQHYQFLPLFHKNTRAFEYQQHRDEWKAKKCKEMGIILVTIPYTVKEENL